MYYFRASIVAEKLVFLKLITKKCTCTKCTFQLFSCNAHSLVTVDWYFNTSEWGKGQVQWFLQFWISIITRKKPHIAENSGLHSYLINCNAFWFVPHWNLPGGFLWGTSLLKHALLCPQPANCMIALYNPLQPCPSHTLMGNTFKGIKHQRSDEAIYENEFSDTGLAAPTKNMEKLFR